jgi:two-component system nitrate/nitrite response regulator NarL
VAVESTVEAQPVCLFLVGLNESLARALARYVNGDPRVALTGVAPSLALACMLLPNTRPDVALVDWSMLDAVLPDALRELRAGRPGLRVVCVASEAETYRAAAAQAGADAVISKDALAGELEMLLHGFFPGRFTPATRGLTT